MSWENTIASTTLPASQPGVMFSHASSAREKRSRTKFRVGDDNIELSHHTNTFSSIKVHTTTTQEVWRDEPNGEVIDIGWNLHHKDLECQKLPSA